MINDGLTHRALYYWLSCARQYCRYRFEDVGFICARGLALRPSAQRRLGCIRPAVPAVLMLCSCHKQRRSILR